MGVARIYWVWASVIAFISSATGAEIKAEIRQLPLTERVALLEELWREAEQDQPRLLDWQKKIVDERLADLEARPENWFSVAELRERLESRLQGAS